MLTILLLLVIDYERQQSGEIFGSSINPLEITSSDLNTANSIISLYSESQSSKLKNLELQV